MGFGYGTIGSHIAGDEFAKGYTGALTIMRYGAGPSGPLRTLAQYMVGSGVTFGYALLPTSKPIK